MKAKFQRIAYKRPWLYRKQKDAIFNSCRYALVEASTKSGKTVGCLIWLFEQAAAGKPGRNYWWVAPIFAQAKIAYRRLKRAVPAELYVSNESELTITLINGTIIWFKSAEHADALYGEDVWAAVIDEATRCKDEAWHAVRSTLTATRGPIRIIGNVKGKKNWAYVLARRAESGEKDMIYSKITAYDAVEAGLVDMAEIEDAKRQLPEAVFRELYLAEPSDDAGNPFGAKAIQDCIVPRMSSKKPIGLGIDLAKSVDWTVIIGLDANKHVCYFDRFQLPWEATIQRITSALRTFNVRTLVDSTGVGDPITEFLQQVSSKVEGYKFSSQSKQQLMEGLAVDIQSRALHYPDGVIAQELDCFEYEYTRLGVRYSAIEGMHDDCVCALALADRCVSQFVEYDEEAEIYDPVAEVEQELRL